MAFFRTTEGSGDRSAEESARVQRRQQQQTQQQMIERERATASQAPQSAD